MTSDTSPPIHDAIHRFTFVDHPVRGEFVQLQQSYQALCQGHGYPPIVVKLLGELLAATSLFTALLKFEGHINLQLQGSGPLNFMTVNGTHDQELRGLAHIRADLPDSHQLLDLLGEDALLIITLTPAQGEKYQGLVRVQHEHIAQVVEEYFQQSEQLSTRLWLSADPETLVCSGFMLQVLPVTSEAGGEQRIAQQASFEHLSVLANTLTHEEMALLSVAQLLHRLYHEEDIHLFEPQTVRFHCGCSRDKTQEALRSVEKTELLTIIEEEGSLDLTCDYCLTTYRFDCIDIEALHSPPSSDQLQ